MILLFTEPEEKFGDSGSMAVHQWAILFILDSLFSGFSQSNTVGKVDIRAGLDSYPIQVMVTLGLSYPICKMW